MHTDYNERQYHLMLEILLDYKRNQIDLGSLINKLEALRNVLEDPAQDWLERFDAAWANLEDVYSFILSENRKTPEPDETRILNESTEELIALVKNIPD